MNWRHMAARLLRRASTSLVGPNAWEILGGGGTVTGQVSGRLSMAGINRPAENSLWVYNCMTARSEAIMQARLVLSDADGNMIEGGELFDLLARPNRWMDGVAFCGAIESLLTLFNRAHLVPISASEGALPDELMVLSPTAMAPVVGVHRPTGQRVPMGWIYREPGTGTDVKFGLEDVITIQAYNPHNPLIAALDPMNPLKRSLQMDMATREQNLAVFLNGGHPDIALETDRNMTPDQANEFLEHWNDTYQGFGKAHKTALLYNGVKISHVGLNPEQLQALDVLKTLTPQEIVSGLRTKPVMAGLMVGETGLSQGTSTNEQKVAWWSETGFSELAKIAGALQQFLVDRFDWAATARGLRRGRALGHAERAEFRRQRARIRAVTAPRLGALYCWFDTGDVPELAEHRWKRIEGFDKLAGRGYPPDDLNDYFDLGLPPHPTNVGTLPFSLQAVGDVTADAGNGGAGGTTEPARAALAPTSRSMQLLDQVEAALDEQGRALAKKWRGVRKTFDAFLKPREKAAAKKWSRFWLEQRNRVLGRLAAARSRELGAGSRDAESEALLKAIFPQDDENGALVARLAPLWAEHVEDGWDFFNAHEKGGAAPNPFAIDDPRVMEALAARKEAAVLANNTTQAALSDVLGKALDEGLGMAETSDLIDAYYRENCIGENTHRPLTAARTETAGIVNDGRMLAARKVGGGLRKGWLHGAPDEPRPAHLDAQTTYMAAPIALEEKFVVNGHACDAPGSTELPIEETANCTCMVVFFPA